MSCQAESDALDKALQDYQDAKTAHDLAEADVASAERTLALDAVGVAACNVTLIFTPVLGPAALPTWLTCKAIAIAKMTNDAVALGNAQKKAKLAQDKLDRAAQKVKDAQHKYDSCLKRSHHIVYV